VSGQAEVDYFRLAVGCDRGREEGDERERHHDDESHDRELISPQAPPGVTPQAALLACGQLPTEPNRRSVTLPRREQVLG
jgi:hypothetical protein